MTAAGSVSEFRDSAPVTQSADIGGPTETGHIKEKPHEGNSIKPNKKGGVLVCKTCDMVETNDGESCRGEDAQNKPSEIGSSDRDPAETGGADELVWACDIGRTLGGKPRKASATKNW